MAMKQKASLEAQLMSWGSAAGLAALVFVLLLTLGGWGIIQAIWMAGVAFLLLGVFNYFIFARPTPPLAGSFPPDMASARGASVPKAVTKGPAEQPAPTAPEASEPAADAVKEATALAQTNEAPTTPATPEAKSVDDKKTQ
ncbi:MAG: hypothetical protein ACXIUV_10875 [Alkalilacustris sp.]